MPAGLPKAYSERATWSWPQRDDDWPSLLPSWSLQPVLLSGDEAEGGEDDDREFWPGPIDLGRALADVDGAVVPTRYYENQYDDGVLVRPYATFPHDWQAVRIATGLLRARHLRPAGGVARKAREEAASFADAVRRWSDRAAQEEPWDRLSEDDSDAVWQLFLDFQSVTLYSLSDAVNESLDATLAGNPDAATWLPAEALALVRIRHALASTGPRGLHASVHQMMLCPPSYVQGDAEERIGEWLLLLELSSDPPIGHHFGEGVHQFWIRPTTWQPDASTSSSSPRRRTDLGPPSDGVEVHLVPPRRAVGEHVGLGAGLHEPRVVGGPDAQQVVALLDREVVDHWTQLSMVSALPSSVVCQAPPSRETSTALMPVCCAQATPPIRFSPASNSSSRRGTSMRDDIFTGPSSPQPRCVQYAEMSSNLLTSQSTTHLQADT